MIGHTTAREGTRRAGRLACAVAGLALAAAGAQADPLRTRIEALAAERGFQLEGIERIGGENARPAGARDPSEQIRRLLSDYNFVMTRGADGRIARLTIVGMRADPALPPAAPEHTGGPGTALAAAEHYVDAALTGPNGRELPMRVMVDTGASTLVLPRSLAQALGFAAAHGREVRVQTANGITEGVLASLASVRVGEAEAHDVAVTFVEDRLLGGKQLLGMSFLSRFRMTIDGRTGTLDLEERGD